MCDYDPLGRRIDAVLEMAIATIDTLADSYEMTSQTTAHPATEVKEDKKDVMIESPA